MKLRVLISFIVVFICHSCVTDSSQKQGASGAEKGPRIIEGADGRKVIIKEADAETNNQIRKKFEQPEIKQVSIEIDIPAKEDWYLLQDYNLEGVIPVGIAYHGTKVFLTDTVQQKLLSLNMTSGHVETVMEDVKVTYVNQRNSRLLMPMYDLDSIFVFRGGTIDDLFKFQIPYELSHPTCFEGLRIDDFTIADQGNHRLVRNKKGEYSLLGSYGSGKEQLDSPTAIVWAGNKIYVTDTGNSRVQVIDEEGYFIKSFGQKDGLKKPTGICSDGKHIFVCDEELRAILVYMPSGKFLYKIDNFTQVPSDLYFNDGRLYVADKEGSTVKVLGNKVYMSM